MFLQMLVSNFRWLIHIEDEKIFEKMSFDTAESEPAKNLREAQASIASFFWRAVDCGDVILNGRSACWKERPGVYCLMNGKEADESICPFT